MSVSGFDSLVKVSGRGEPPGRRRALAHPQLRIAEVDVGRLEARLVHGLQRVIDEDGVDPRAAVPRWLMLDPPDAAGAGQADVVALAEPDGRPTGAGIDPQEVESIRGRAGGDGRGAPRPPRRPRIGLEAGRQGRRPCPMRTVGHLKSGGALCRAMPRAAAVPYSGGRRAPRLVEQYSARRPGSPVIWRATRGLSETHADCYRAPGTCRGRAAAAGSLGRDEAWIADRCLSSSAALGRHIRCRR